MVFYLTPPGKGINRKRDSGAVACLCLFSFGVHMSDHISDMVLPMVLLQNLRAMQGLNRCKVADIKQKNKLP